jgi:hypothetical protein
MRTYIFEWEEKTNTILLKPTTNNKGGLITDYQKKIFVHSFWKLRIKRLKHILMLVLNI